MIPRLLASAALAAPALLAQFALYVNGRPAGELVDLGPVATGDVLMVAGAVRNIGGQSALLSSMSLAGSGFQLSGVPSLPQSLNPGEKVEFQIAFQADLPATYSAVMRAPGISTILRAVGVRSLSVYLEQGASLKELSSSSAADFGGVDRDDRRVLHLLIQNPTEAPLPSAAALSGSGSFRVLNAGPAALGRGESFTLDVAFEPTGPGPQNGQLTVDRRHIPLSGTGVEPPPPLPQVALERVDDRLARVQVRLSTAARASGEGHVELGLLPYASGAGDPALLFPTVNNRSAAFQFVRGDTAGRFASGEWIELQVGTTAGTVLATAQIGNASDQGSLIIPPAPVGIETVKAVRLFSSLEVTVTGFDNSRSAGPLSFTFYDRAGKTMVVGVDATRDFQAYFGGSTLGGVFQMRAVFPVTGSVAEIAAVETEFRNVAGSSKVRQEFQ